MIKALRKLGTEGTFLNFIKAVYDKPIANIVLNGEKLKPFRHKSRKRQGCLWQEGREREERFKSAKVKQRKTRVGECCLETRGGSHCPRG
jgi:hypothetical protein